MYDLIVIGLGAMGSATAYHAAKRGYKVLALDAFERNHANGSSHGRSRIIRESYAEGPQYVPLVQRAYELWGELERESGRQLLTMTGGLYVGSPEGDLVAGVLRSAAEHGLSCDYLTPAEAMSRFPGFHIPESLVAVYEERGGVLDAEACVGAHLDIAARYGADLRHGEPVVRWMADGAGVLVHTPQGSYAGERLIIAAGSWTGEILAELESPLTAWRVVNAYFEPESPEFDADRCPFFLLEVDEGTYYGLPAMPGQGFKVGRHDKGEICTPQTIRRSVDGSEIEELRAVLDHYLPGAAGTLKATSTCIYTMTPDEDFIIDRHPQHRQVVYASACSGHGFKFSAAIGEALTEMSLGGGTPALVETFGAGRFAAARKQM